MGGIICSTIQYITGKKTTSGSKKETMIIARLTFLKKEGIYIDSFSSFFNPRPFENNDKTRRVIAIKIRDKTIEIIR